MSYLLSILGRKSGGRLAYDALAAALILLFAAVGDTNLLRSMGSEAHCEDALSLVQAEASQGRQSPGRRTRDLTVLSGPLAAADLEDPGAAKGPEALSRLQRWRHWLSLVSFPHSFKETADSLFGGHRLSLLSFPHTFKELRARGISSGGLVCAAAILLTVLVLCIVLFRVFVNRMSAGYQPMKEDPASAQGAPNSPQRSQTASPKLASPKFSKPGSVAAQSSVNSQGVLGSTPLHSGRPPRGTDGLARNAQLRTASANSGHSSGGSKEAHCSSATSSSMSLSTSTTMFSINPTQGSSKNGNGSNSGHEATSARPQEPVGKGGPGHPKTSQALHPPATFARQQASSSSSDTPKGPLTSFYLPLYALAGMGTDGRIDIFSPSRGVALLAAVRMAQGGRILEIFTGPSAESPAMMVRPLHTSTESGSSPTAAAQPNGFEIVGPDGSRAGTLRLRAGGAAVEGPGGKQMLEFGGEATGLELIAQAPDGSLAGRLARSSTGVSEADHLELTVQADSDPHLVLACVLTIVLFSQPI
mmetsp:Transcript_71829/g.203799  ORF Transcript_71829/g.203799 Transcript_71829/m.203799 type:complete len:531 (-) Transcript_71829:33-1625(-)